jgi:glycosyltransferase involved in cell wall biosynthesis
MVKEHFPEKTNYIPHAVPKDLYRPLPDDVVKDFRKKLVGSEKQDDFIVGYVSRNARRKMPSDIIVSWKIFLDELKKKYGHRKATLVMHTEPLDPEGPNLYHVVETLQVQDNVIFSKSRVTFEEMSLLYNSFDTIVNRSTNEGFGLPTLESMMCGKPIIAIKTGGLTRQVENIETGEQYGVGMDPEVRALVGNQMVPYIYEDLISHKTLADAYMKMYKLGPEGRKELGLKAMSHAHKDYDINEMTKQWDNTLSGCIENWQNNKPALWTHTEI